MIHRRISEPTAEPISLAQARLHLRVQDPELDPLIAQLIGVARRQAEEATGRALAPHDELAVLDAFPVASTWGSCGIRLPSPPVTAVVSVTYVDESGATQTLPSEAWLLDAESEPCWLFPAYDTPWPTTRAVPNAVKVRVTCGYTVATLPAPLRQWMLLHIAHWFENPNALADPKSQPLPFVDNLLAPFTLALIGE